MKLIDERGKVLGLINIVDLIILSVVLLVAAGAAYKYIHKSTPGKTVTVEFEVMVPHVRPEQAQAIKAGDRMVQGNSYTNVTVKEVLLKPGYSINIDARGQRVESFDPYLKDIHLINTGTTTLSSATINLGGQDIRVGKEYYVKSRDYEFRGNIIKIVIRE